MSSRLPRKVEDMVDAFSRLPGIGPKMASRLTFYLLQKSEYDILKFIHALEGIKDGLRDCAQCGNISENELCVICADPKREQNSICVVEGALDVLALERTASYFGLYHVLGGALSPIDGIGPDQLRIKSLVTRVDPATKVQPVEVILATNPSLEGEATAAYISQLLAERVGEQEVVVSRIARGLPMGSDLEYADPTTLLRALEGRKSI